MSLYIPARTGVCVVYDTMVDWMVEGSLYHTIFSVTSPSWDYMVIGYHCSPGSVCWLCWDIMPHSKVTKLFLLAARPQALLSNVRFISLPFRTLCTDHHREHRDRVFILRLHCSSCSCCRSSISSLPVLFLITITFSPALHLLFFAELYLLVYNPATVYLAMRWWPVINCWLGTACHTFHIFISRVQARERAIRR